MVTIQIIVCIFLGLTMFPGNLQIINYNYANKSAGQLTATLKLIQTENKCDIWFAH